MNFLIKIIKYIIYFCLICVLLVFILNYSSPFFRYPAFKWITSNFTDEFVVKNIKNIEFSPKLLTNQISLTGLEIYNKNAGERYSIEINNIKGELDLIDYWNTKILFKKISIDNVSASLETFLGVLLSQGNLNDLDSYKNLKIEFSDAADKQIQPVDQTKNNTILEKLQIDKKWLSQITREVELTNSKIIAGKKEIGLKKAKLSFDGNLIFIETSLSVDQIAGFDVDLIVDNQNKVIRFNLKNIPVNEVLSLLNNPKLKFLANDYQSNIQGTFDYKNKVLTFDGFDFFNSILNIIGSAKFEQANNKNIELAAQIKNKFDLKNFKQIWPRVFFNSRLNDWLDKAFIDGSITKTEFKLKSSLEDLSKINQKEIFEFNIQAKNIVLNFDDAWQNLVIDDAEISVTNLGIDIKTLSKQENAAEIQVFAKSLFFDEKPAMDIKINILSDEKFITEFINKNPLNQNEKLNSLTSMQLSGKANSHISLLIPFNDENIQYQGQIKIIDNSIELSKYLNFDKINGEVSFDPNDIKTSFNAVWWNNLVSVELENINEDELAINFDLTLKTENSLNQIFSQLGFKNKEVLNRLNKSIQGESHFYGKVTATNNLNQLNQSPVDMFNFSIAMNSSLEGIELNLIDPFIKKKELQTPLNLAFKFNSGKFEFQSLQFNNQVNANLLKGVEQDLIDISFIDLNLDSEKIKFLISQSSSKTLKEKLNQTPLHKLGVPDFDFTIYRLRFDNKEMGSLSFKLRNNQDNAQIKDIALKSPTLMLGGEIISDSGKTSLSLISNKDIPLSDYFNYLQMKPITKEAITKANIDISWPGQIWDYENKDVVGSLNLNTQNGLLLTNLESSFFPRLIKELSLNSIKNRLENILMLRKLAESLNPTTVFDEGIEFDTLDIDLNFKDNKIYNKKMHFKSESINIALTGYTDLSDKSLHQKAVVNPDLFKVLPAIGIITGNIPVALAGLMSDKLFDTKEFFKVNFDIVGEVNNPEIKLSN